METENRLLALSFIKAQAQQDVEAIKLILNEVGPEVLAAELSHIAYTLAGVAGMVGVGAENIAQAQSPLNVIETMRKLANDSR
jgi:hypothetical protein